MSAHTMTGQNGFLPGVLWRLAIGGGAGAGRGRRSAGAYGKFRAVLKMLAGAAIAGVAVWGAGYTALGAQLGKMQLASLADASGFKPASMVVRGNSQVGAEHIIAALGTLGNQSMFAFDVVRAREKLLQNPWLSRVDVSKVYPGTILVDVAERQPFAFWKSEDQVRVIARDGTVLGKASPEHLLLPQVVGAGANEAAPEFVVSLSRFPAIASRSKAFVRVAGRRWNLMLKNDVTVLLPETGWREALVELNTMQQDRQLLDRELVQVDLRIPDRLVLRLDEKDAEERRKFLETLTSGKRRKS